MPNLIFKTRRGYQIDPSRTKPTNESLQLENQLNVTKALAPYIDRINACGAYVQVTVEQDGQRFRNDIVGCEENLFGEIMDKLSGI